MRRILACAVILLVPVGFIVAPDLPWWAMSVGGVAAAGAAWKVGRCPHRAPLALLPATTDINGVPLPARWYCDDCGLAWPANFEREHTPVQRFKGYDESKAVHAAKRAEELVDAQREMALKRGGMRTQKRPLSRDTADVVSFGTGPRLARPSASAARRTTNSTTRTA